MESSERTIVGTVNLQPVRSEDSTHPTVTPLSEVENAQPLRRPKLKVYPLGLRHRRLQIDGQPGALPHARRFERKETYADDRTVSSGSDRLDLDARMRLLAELLPTENVA